MYELTEHIEYLVYQHDCVVIPGVGAIIAYHTPAYVDSEKNLIYPPTRLLTFNGQITHSDGLLASSVARRESVSYDKAVEMVAQSVSDMMTCLESQNEFVLGQLGYLRKNDEGSVEFVPNNCFCHSFSLGAYKPLSLASESTGTEKNVISARGERYSFVRRFANVAASVVLLLMLGLMLSTPVIDNDAVMASMTSLKFMNSTETESVQNLESDIELAIAMPDPDSSTAIAIERRRNASEEATYGPYYLIVASLPNEAKAEEFIASCDDIDENFQILKTPTRCRVYIDNATTLAKAYEARQIKGRLDRFPDIWVFRK